METSLQIIGREIYIDIATHMHVPAKIDTGADTSSIWASNIVREGSTLSFTLFDPSSEYYTGERMQTHTFEEIGVRNANGKTYRYIVTLPAKVMDNLYDVQFTLTDRSLLAYPALLGVRFLQKRFLVDPAIGLSEAVRQSLYDQKIHRMAARRKES